jgi:uncharacterized protein
MIQVFVDVTAWVALLNENDPLYRSAHQVLEDLRRQDAHLVTTEFVLLEVANVLSGVNIRRHTVAFVNGLRELALLTIVPSGSDLFSDAWEVYSKHLDKAWSLTNCTSFTVMKQLDLTLAFTSDHHFEHAGFVILLLSQD